MRAKTVAAAALGLLITMPFAVSAATIEEVSAEVRLISGQVASIDASTSVSARAQILANVAARLPVIVGQLIEIKYQQLISRVRASISATTSSVSTINASTSEEARAQILGDAAIKLRDAYMALIPLKVESMLGFHLAVGSAGNEVASMQTALRQDATLYQGPVTGYYGLMTKAAIEKLQARNNITVTGEVNQATSVALMQQFGVNVFGR